jgi:hypothetical protein
MQAVKSNAVQMTSVSFANIPSILKLLTFSHKHEKSSSIYFDYYHYDRTHYGLGKDTPVRRPVQPRTVKAPKAIELPRVGGLHHRYEWKIAA